MQDEKPKHGARVYRMQNKLLVKQTVLRGTPPEYVIDEQRERYVSENDDSALPVQFEMPLRENLRERKISHSTTFSLR
jgi:hypothetical protein